MSVGEKSLQEWLKQTLPNVDDKKIELLLNGFEEIDICDIDDLKVVSNNEDLLMDICNDAKLNYRDSIKLCIEITKYLVNKQPIMETEKYGEKEPSTPLLIINPQEHQAYKKLISKQHHIKKEMENYSDLINENKNLYKLVNEILKLTQNKLNDSFNKQFEQFPSKVQTMYEEYERNMEEYIKNQENDLKLLNETEKKWRKHWTIEYIADKDVNQADEEQKKNNDSIDDINNVLNQIKNKSKPISSLILYREYLRKLVSRIESNTKHLFVFQVGDNENIKCKSNEELIEENKENKQLIDKIKQELNEKNELINKLKYENEQLIIKTKNMNELNQFINNLNEEKNQLNLTVSKLKEQMKGIDQKMQPLNYFETIYDQLKIHINNYENEVKSVYDDLIQQCNKNAPLSTINNIIKNKKIYEQVIQNLSENVRGVTNKIQNLQNNNNNLFTTQNIFKIIQDNTYFNAVNPSKISPAFTDYNAQYATSEQNNKVIKSTAQASSYLTYASSTGYSNGKYYWTMKVHNNASNYSAFGVIGSLTYAKSNGYHIGSHGDFAAYGYCGNMHNNNNHAISNGCEVKILLDLDSKLVICYKDNVPIGYGFIPNTMNICYPAISSYGANNHIEVIS